MAITVDDDTNLGGLIVFSIILGLEFLFSILIIWDIQVRLFINGVTKRLLYVMLFLTWLGTATFLFEMFPGTNGATISLFFTFCAVFNFIPILMTFAWRIHLTFSTTAHGFSKRQKWMFGFILFFLIALPAPRFYVDTLFTRVCLYLFFAEFFLASIYTMNIFYSKFKAYVSAEATSPRDIEREESTDLSREQKELIGFAAKYTLLFVIASLTSMASFVGQIFFDNQLALIPDQICNVICIFLQFQYTDKLYMKCCGLCHKVTELSISFQIKTLLFADQLVDAAKNVADKVPLGYTTSTPDKADKVPATSMDFEADGQRTADL